MRLVLRVVIGNEPFAVLLVTCARSEVPAVKQLIDVYERKRERHSAVIGVRSWKQILVVMELLITLTKNGRQYWK